MAEATHFKIESLDCSLKEAKKIGILTHPLRTNYGGILQAFALAETLKSRGNDVMVINRLQDDYKIKKLLRRVLQLTGLRNYRHRAPQFPQTAFINQHITRSDAIDNTTLLVREIKRSGIDCIITGSDQVWRSNFVRDYSFNHWGSMMSKLPNVKLISYAASISENEWNYTQAETRRIKQYLKFFSGLSVREDSARRLCEMNLNVSPKVVIDPTLLHGADFYARFAVRRDSGRPYIFVYWLGDEDELASTLSLVAKENLDVVRVNLRQPESFVSVEQWVGMIQDAHVVVTDSFHGMVFSILFHRQFLCSQNQSGGVDRIKNLFDMLEISEKLNNPFMELNYQKIDNRLDVLRKEALTFIEQSME